MVTGSNWKAIVAALPYKPVASALVGTCFIFGEGNDIDILLQVSDLDDAYDAYRDAHYQRCTGANGKDYPVGVWFAVRLGSVNLLVTDDSDHYDQTLEAARVCKYLAMAGKLEREDRQTRVSIHQLLRKEFDIDSL